MFLVPHTVTYRDDGWSFGDGGKKSLTGPLVSEWVSNHVGLQSENGYEDLLSRVWDGSVKGVH